MKRRIVVAGAVTGLVLVAVALALFQPWLLLVDERVDEDIPTDALATDTAGLGGADAAPDRAAGSRAPEPSPSEAAPRWTELTSGEFIDAEHGTKGTARIVRAADGSRELWLEDLATSNGPDLHVWITDRPSGGDCAGCADSWGIYDDGRYEALGALKGNQGNQRYAIPDDARLSPMTSVVIWCDRFNVAFGSADIT